ncbi:MAG TPA: putative toxin-antitoxin system toxin component, PIN family [Solirubrobacteraceae bacterium]|jgi:putative PIN family toxin of toxin-antitoxin system|nr:putative toxin-antitoxin system toxin component, PIN family [Solirubrobacteraceae bacterium]
MLRVVADANVLVSAALARSPQAPSVLTLDAALDGRLELITSPLLLQEIALVLGRPRLQKYLSVEEALRFITDLAAQTSLLADPTGSASTPRGCVSGSGSRRAWCAIPSC